MDIDKYAIQKTLCPIFHLIKKCGNVFETDYKGFKDIDLLLGGSPCTYWSISQTKHRETVSSEKGWELFQQYVRCLRKVQPKYFLYENNASIPDQIRKAITNEFGFELMELNSTLLSAQSRKRLYWCGIKIYNLQKIKNNVKGYYILWYYLEMSKK